MSFQENLQRSKPACLRKFFAPRDNLVAASLFGVIHGLVRSVDERIPVVSMHWEGRDAAGDRG